MDRVSNPYRPSAGGQPPELAGREDILTQADIKIAQTIDKRPAHCLLLVGVRGIGKTVALRKIEQLATNRKAKTMFLEATSDGQFLPALAHEVRQSIMSMDNGVSRTTKQALGVLKSFTLTLGLEGLSLGIKEPAEYGRADTGNAENDLRDVISAMGHAAAAHKTAIIIIIDELQYLSKDELAGMLSALHRTMQLDLPVLLVAAGLPNLPRRVLEAKTYAERMFTIEQLGPLEHDDVARALEGPAAKQRVAFTPEAIDEIARVTEGYPYFVQTWGYNVWDVAEHSPITIDDVHTASANAYRYLDRTFFHTRSEQLTPSELEYLTALAELGPGPQRSGAVASQTNRAVKSSADVRDRLIQKGLIYSPNYGEVEFSVPLFDDYLRRHPAGTSPGRKTAPQPRHHR